MPRPLRPEEELARRIARRHLGVECFQHDDGQSAGLFDLRVGESKQPSIAIEVTGAVDGLFTQTWNSGPAKGALRPGVPDNWVLEIRPGASAKRLKASIVEL